MNELRKLFTELKPKCRTKGQIQAFNELVKTFTIPTITDQIDQVLSIVKKGKLTVGEVGYVVRVLEQLKQRKSFSMTMKKYWEGDNFYNHVLKKKIQRVTGINPDNSEIYYESFGKYGEVSSLDDYNNQITSRTEIGRTTNELILNEVIINGEKYIECVDPSDNTIMCTIKNSK